MFTELNGNGASINITLGQSSQVCCNNTQTDDLVIRYGSNSYTDLTQIKQINASKVSGDNIWMQQRTEGRTCLDNNDKYNLTDEDAVCRQGKFDSPFSFLVDSTFSS